MSWRTGLDIDLRGLYCSDWSNSKYSEIKKRFAVIAQINSDEKKRLTKIGHSSARS